LVQTHGHYQYTAGDHIKFIAPGVNVTKNIAVIPGEDAAPEAMDQTLRVIDSLSLDLQWHFPTVGEQASASHGSTFPDIARQVIDDCDTTLFGSTSGPSGRALYYLRWGKQTFANVRPAKWLPGFNSPLADPENVDFVIVRENLEDLYLSLEGELTDLAALGLSSRTTGLPPESLGEGFYALKAITRQGSERVIRYAFDLARRRREKGLPGHVTLGSKWNMLPKTDGLFRDVGASIAAENPDIPYQAFIIDDLAHRLVSQADSFDVIVMPNLYGDILSDAAAGLVGGLGLAPSGCYGDDYAYFESAHGTAPDIAGQGIINPTATLMSAAMMLEHLGFEEASERIFSAIADIYVRRDRLTPDQGGTAGTAACCDAIIERVNA
jgi:isocitrate/isopropylmalate dehydrogenase